MLDHHSGDQRKDYLFAISIPQSWQQNIVSWRAEHFPSDTGQPVAAKALLLPLLFMQNLNHDQITQFQQQLRANRQQHFTLRLNDAVYWPKSRQIWLGCRPADRRLLQLAALLRSRGAKMGCPVSPHPWHPRLTLWRQVKTDTQLPVIDIDWSIPISQFSLFCLSAHGRGEGYKLMTHFQLTEG